MGGIYMKIVHTADWHLGKLVQGIYMTEDQRYILREFIKDMQSIQPDVIVVAGDLYDRSIPPTEAVQLLDDTFHELVLTLRIPVIAIAGNHDSASRIDFASSLMEKSGLHMVGKWHKESPAIRLHDELGPVDFWPIPFMDPSEVRFELEDETIRTHQQAMEKIVASISERMDASIRNVFVGHAFVTKGGEQLENDSEGERPLSIGGTECIDASLFMPFDYAALGHLHGAHFVLDKKIHYAGSPLKYSISEEKHKKGYMVIELALDACTVEKKELIAKRDMRTIESTMADLLTHDRNEDYVFVTLLDEQPVLSPMEKVRKVYPNAMHVTRKVVYAERNENEQTLQKQQMSDTELFEAFYKEMEQKDVPPTTKALFEQLLEEQLRHEREGGNESCNQNF